MQYPAIFKSSPDGGFVVSFRDIPEATTQGDDLNEAMSKAQDALLTAMSFYFDDKRPVPMPSKLRRGERLVNLPISISAKVLLRNEMLAQRIRPVDLARMMQVIPQDVTLLQRLDHKTKIDAIDTALRAMGKQLDVKLVGITTQANSGKA